MPGIILHWSAHILLSTCDSAALILFACNGATYGRRSQFVVRSVWRYPHLCCCCLFDLNQWLLVPHHQQLQSDFTTPPPPTLAQVLTFFARLRCRRLISLVLFLTDARLHPIMKSLLSGKYLVTSIVFCYIFQAKRQWLSYPAAHIFQVTNLLPWSEGK